MLVTLLGIMMLVRLRHEKNAQSPMLVTGRPLVVLGMVTSPPEPVYPAMVIVPLLVVQVNWACTAAGKVKSSSGTSLVVQAVLKREAIVFAKLLLAREVCVFIVLACIDRVCYLLRR